jgi:hypothetical protein
MEAEERLAALEQEVKTLKSSIQKTLIEIQASLPEKPAPTVRWQKKAWALALLNTVLATVLFTNIYFFVPDLAPFEIAQTVQGWLRALWIAMAFLWLLLQLYPLALLLEEEDRQWQGIVWRNAAAFLRARPGVIVAATLVVLVIAIVNTILPVTWLVVAIILLLVAVAAGLLSARDLLREKRQARRKN